MIYQHQDLQPIIASSASIAPTAVVSGNVTVGPDTRVAHGAVLTAEGGPLHIGSRCIVMENAVLRATRQHPLHVANNVLVGPRAYVCGCTVEDDVFLATGATIFNGAHIGAGTEVRVNGVVHVRTTLRPGSLVPIGWVAVGSPAAILPPEAHDRIWTRQEPLEFNRTVFGLAQDDSESNLMPRLCARYSRWLARHDDDRLIDDGIGSERT